MQCTFGGCDKKAVFHLTHVESRRCRREEHLCEEHARPELTGYPILQLIGSPTLRERHTGIPGVLPDAKCFDIDLVVISEVHDEQVVYLREVGGDQKIPILIGIFEATSLARRMTGHASPRPLTHDATAMIIRALGAEVEDVVIDALEQRSFHAKLRMRQGGDLLTVDIRPSDAFMLAAAFDRPIFFTNKVLDLL
jgi:uncharacterized protein